MNKKEKESILEIQKFFKKNFSKEHFFKSDLNYAWYLGDGDILMEAYLNAEQKLYATTYSGVRNSRTYFWNIASRERDIKRSHSGLPRMIVKTLINVLGEPEIKVMKNVVNLDTGSLEEVEDDETTKKLNEILKENDFKNVLTKQQEPLMMVMGDGCYIVNVDKSISEHPIIEYVDSRNCSFEFKANRVTKVYTRSYYSKGFDSYVLVQERGKDIEGGYVDYRLYKLNNSESREISNEVPLSTLEETKDLKKITFLGLKTIPAIPCIYDYDPILNRGVSIFTSKLDIFDDIDQALSQGSNCVRLSTPVETIDESLLESNADGERIAPSRYDRRYMVVKKSNDNIGVSESGIVSNVPQIDFAKYSNEVLSLVSLAITGLISPATLGLDVSKRDNGEAQREKEKETLYTRKNIIETQEKILQNLFELVLKMDDLIQGKENADYTITIDYDEYGNPTQESKLNSLYPAFVAGAISPEKYATEVWGNKMSEEEKQKELEYLESQRIEPQELNLDYE